jgi:hypothetical protein
LYPRKSNAHRAGVKDAKIFNLAASAFGAAGDYTNAAPRGTVGYCSRGGKQAVIYLIYKDGEILVETDDIEFVRSYVSQNQECSVRDARTGKKVPVE